MFNGRDCRRGMYYWRRLQRRYLSLEKETADEVCITGADCKGGRCHWRRLHWGYVSLEDTAEEVCSTSTGGDYIGSLYLWLRLHRKNVSLVETAGGYVALEQAADEIWIPGGDSKRGTYHWRRLQRYVSFEETAGGGLWYVSLDETAEEVHVCLIGRDCRGGL